MTSLVDVRAIGASRHRIDAIAKTQGEARYAYDYPVEDVVYGVCVSAPVARGTIRGVDASRALLAPDVVAVLSHVNAPALNPIGKDELLVLHSPTIWYRGQIIAAVFAETLESAQEAADLIEFDIAVKQHDSYFSLQRDDFYKPEHVIHQATEARRGDVRQAVLSAEVVIDHHYRTSPTHHVPMEPHSSLAIYRDGSVTLYESAQDPHRVRVDLAGMFGLAPGQVRIINRTVGGAFGSKGDPTIQMVVAVSGSRLLRRPVKVALTRRQLFACCGYRSPTVQRVRLAADANGVLSAFEHTSYAQTSRVREFCEPCTLESRTMYQAPNRLSTHRLVALDVPSPVFCRAPGAAPGFFALESAMDELARACDVDPVVLRLRNEPAVDPDTGAELSSRTLAECLTRAAGRYGWSQRRAYVDGDRAIGHGMAAGAYPSRQAPSSARATVREDGSVTIEIAATDAGTGASTILQQIASDELRIRPELVRMKWGDSSLPYAIGAFGSLGTASWGHAVSLVCRELREALEECGGDAPAGGLAVSSDTSAELEGRPPLSHHSYGAQFAEVAVDRATGEVRVNRLVGCFDVGTVVNPLTLRSQLLGGMTWGISMALHEASLMDPAFGAFINSDFGAYHIATNADIRTIEIDWLDERDSEANPVGTKGAGEIGIVGTAAAIANAVYDAIGVRIRHLPITPERILEALSDSN